MKKRPGIRRALCGLLVALCTCQAAQSQSARQWERRLDLSAHYASGQILPAVAGDDKSRLVHTASQAAELWTKLEGSSRLLVELLPLTADTLSRPQNRDDFLARLERLQVLLSQLQPPLGEMSDALARLEHRVMPLPYRLALYPSLHLRLHRGTLWLLAGATWSDDSIALDMTAQYIRIGIVDEGVGLSLRHDLNPQKQRASRALQALGQEMRSLSGADSRTLTRLITSLQQLSAFTLSQQIPVWADDGVLWSVSGQYLWADSALGEHSGTTVFSLVLAWMDRMSSYGRNHQPVLRRWEWQVGVEHRFRSRLTEGFSAIFVRWRPARQLWDCSLFWSHRQTSGDELGIALPTHVGIAPY